MTARRLVQVDVRADRRRVALVFPTCRVVRHPRNHARSNRMIKEEPIMHVFQLLARLDEGEVLEKDLSRYQIRTDPVSKRLAGRLIEEGWVDAPPDLFNPTGGHITDLGRDVLRSNGGLADV